MRWSSYIKIYRADPAIYNNKSLSLKIKLFMIYTGDLRPSH